MDARKVLWTDPTNWMEHTVSVAGHYTYRHVLGDNTDLSDAQDSAFIEELIR